MAQGNSLPGICTNSPLIRGKTEVLRFLYPSPGIMCNIIKIKTNSELSD